MSCQMRNTLRNDMDSQDAQWKGGQDEACTKIITGSGIQGSENYHRSRIDDGILST